MSEIKKSIFRTAVKECDLNLQNDYADVELEGSVIISVLSNDGLLVSPIVTLTSTPLYGTLVLNPDNTITYTSNGTSELQDSFTYSVASEGCTDTATVFVEHMPLLEPLPNYNVISLNKNTSGGALACAISGANAVTRYIDTVSFSAATFLYDDLHGLHNSVASWYTNGTISRHWTGTVFDDIVTC